MRPLQFDRGFIGSALGSCLASCGQTRVICTAMVDEGVPLWLQGRRQGWLTAEYGMLPGSTERRRAREGRRSSGVDGRSMEIQRLLGRALRPIIDLKALGERTIHIDCDVIEADGGTRTTAINGAFVALYDACTALLRTGRVSTNPINAEVGAVSVGLVDGEILLDLDYLEDRDAEADVNVVMTGDGRLIEVQATAEKHPFSFEQLGRILELARDGLEQVRAARLQVLEDLLL